MDHKIALLTTAAFGAALAIGPMVLPEQADAGPIPYVNSPMDTPQALVNQAIASMNASNPANGIDVTCSGNTSMTCNGNRIIASVTNLTTNPGGNVSALVTIADSAVTAASDALCQVNDYAGAGQPGVGNVSTTAGNITLVVQNTTVAGGAALNATVPVLCMIYN